MLKNTKTWFVIAVVLAAFAACDSDEVIDCVDLCDELDSCFADGFDSTECVDGCEEQAEAAIDTCDLCLDDNDRECVACGAECAIFTDIATD